MNFLVLDKTCIHCSFGQLLQDNCSTNLINTIETPVKVPVLYCIGQFMIPGYDGGIKILNETEDTYIPALGLVYLCQVNKSSMRQEIPTYLSVVWFTCVR